MKNSLRLLSVVLSLTAGAWCQNITASGSTCATSNACVSSQVTQAQGGATITLAGTFVGTVQFEASVDGVTWKAIPSTDATPVTSATGTGVWQFNVAAYTTIRARCSAFTSGPIVVTINTSTASARSGGGSSSGGAVSSVTGAGTVLCSPTTGAVTCTGSGGGTSAGTTNDVQIAGAGGTFAADTGVFTENPSTHVLNVGSGIAIGTTPPTACGTATGCIALNEASGAGTPTAAMDYMRADSATHKLVCSFNGGAEAACNSGGVTSVGATSPVVSSGGTTPSISISGVTALQGNGAKLQLATGTTTTGHYPSYDANGNLIDSTQPSGGGNHNIDLMAGAAQLTAGCSINNSFLTNTQVTCLFQSGSATVPQQAFPQFTVAGTLGTTVTNATALYIGPKTVPSDYTASGNLTIHFAVANPTVITGAETFSVRYAHATPPAVAQPTFVATDYSTASLTVSGTVNNTVTGTATITAPSLTAGDQVWFVVYLSAKTATDNPYLTQLYMSY